MYDGRRNNEWILKNLNRCLIFLLISILLYLSFNELTGIDVADNDQRNVNLFLSHCCLRVLESVVEEESKRRIGGTMPMMESLGG